LREQEIMAGKWRILTAAILAVLIVVPLGCSDDVTDVDQDEMVVLETNKGPIEIKLFPESAPLAVENFKTHAANGYYDGGELSSHYSEFRRSRWGSDGNRRRGREHLGSAISQRNRSEPAL
jgi:hypothetical protein